MDSRATVSTILLALTLGTASAYEQPPAQRGQIKTSRPFESLTVSAVNYPWAAIGKLNNGVFGACTAVLISQNYALTAAHCLFFRALRRYLPSEAFHFILGYEHERFANHYRVMAYYVPKSYDPLRPFETIGSDWALLLVSGDPHKSALPLAIATHLTPTSESNLATAGYSGRMPYRMSADQKCRFVGKSADDNLLFNNCYAPDGLSGGPLLVKAPDRQSYAIAGIHVGNQTWQGRALAIAISAETIWREIKPCVEDRQCQFQHVAQERDPTAAEILAGPPKPRLKKAPDSNEEANCNETDYDCGLLMPDNDTVFRRLP